MMAQTFASPQRSPADDPLPQSTLMATGLTPREADFSKAASKGLPPLPESGQMAGLESKQAWQPSDFADFFPKEQQAKKLYQAPERATDSYDSTMTDFDAERAIAEYAGDDRGWEALRHCIKGVVAATTPAEDAAMKLINNHVAVLHDITNPAPSTQRDLVRVDTSHAEYVDQALREVARRLLYKRRARARKLLPEVMDTSNSDAVATWSNTATFLCGRIQCQETERPGRPPDMSPQTAVEMRAVLQALWWESWEARRPRQKRSR